MPGTTDCRAYPFPVDTDPIDVAGDINKLANKVDDDVCLLYDDRRRCGVGLTQGSQLFAPDTNTPFSWPGEVYDTDNFHVAGSTDVIIPANLNGIFAVSLLVVMNDPATQNDLARLVIGQSIRQAVIPPGQRIGNVSYTGPINATVVIQGTFWNNAADVGHFVAASLEVLRVGRW